MPRVFVSYAHDDESHKQLVVRFWAFLRSCGVDAHVDIAAADRPQDWPLWMTEQISNADYVAIVASPAYRERAGVQPDPNEGRGVQFEASVIRDLYYANQKSGRERFVSVVLPGRSPEELPLWLGPASRTYFRVTDFTPEGAESLLRHFTGQHHIVPPLGEVPKFDTSFVSSAGVMSMAASDPSQPSAGRSLVPTSPSRLPATEELWDSIMDVEECFRRNLGDRNAQPKCREHLVRLRQLRLRLRTHLSGRTLLIVDDYVDTLLEVQEELEKTNNDEAIEGRVETITHASAISAVADATTRLDLLRDLLARQVAELRRRATYELANATRNGSSTAPESDLPTVDASDELGEMVAQSLLAAMPDSRIRVCLVEGFDYSVESAAAGLMHLRIRPDVLNIDLLTVPKQRPDIPGPVPSAPLLTVMDVAGDGVVLGVWHFTRRLRWNYRWRGLPTQSMIELAVSRIKQRVLSLQG